MEDEILLGELDLYSDTDTLIAYMNDWCATKTLEIEEEYNTNGYSKELDRLIVERACTFDEYHDLFRNIDEVDYEYHPAYEFGRVETKAELKRFIQGYKDNEESYADFIKHKGSTDLGVFLSRIESRIPHHYLNYHTYCVAKTRAGKTTLMLNILFNAIKRKTPRESFLVLDPHGSFAKDLKNLRLVSNQLENVVYLDVASFDDYVPCLNIFEQENKHPRAIAQSTGFILDAFDSLLQDQELSGGMKRVMMHCIYFALYRDGSDLRTVMKMMQLLYNMKKTKDYLPTAEEQDLLNTARRIPNELTREFFLQGWQTVDPRTIDSVLTRLDSVLLDTNLRNFLTGSSTFDLGKLLNSGKIVILNNDFVKLGSTGSDLIGRLFIGACHRAFQERMNIPAEFRPKTRIFMDEAQRSLGDNIETTLSEMGKYEVGLFIAHQYAEQMEDDMFKGILSNTYTKIVGANSAKNASIMAKEMKVKADKLADVPKYHFQLNIDGKDKGMFKASSFILDKSLYVSYEESKEVDAYMIKKYYKEIATSSVLLPDDSKTLNDQDR